jgi:uncharacterized protein
MPGPRRAAAAGLEQWRKGTGWIRACPASRRRIDATIGIGDPGAQGRPLQSLVAKQDSGMWYAIEGYDGDDVLASRMQARPQHLARLTALRDAGRLLLAGPCPAIDTEDPGPAGFSGSIVIAEFASLEDARTWADADPYVSAGVYARVEVRPFKAVLP